MAEQLDPKELVTVEDLAISNMWEITALVEVLKRNGVLTGEELYDAIHELRQRHRKPPRWSGRPVKLSADRRKPTPTQELSSNK